MRIWEMSYPYLLAIISGFFIWWMKWDIKDVKNFDSILNTTATISSIVVGFLGTIVSILFTLTDSKVMRRIRENNAQNLLTSYMKHSIVSGLLITVYSLLLFLFLDSEGVKSNVLLSIFVVFLSYFMLTTYRVFSIVSKILASIMSETAAQEQREAQTQRFTPEIND